MLNIKGELSIMRNRLFVFGTFLIYFNLQLSYNNAVEFKMTNAVCSTNNESLVRIYECRLRAISRNKTIFNFNGTFLQPAHKIRLHMQLFQRLNGYKPWLYNETIDVCRFLKKPYNPFVILVFNLFIEFTNFNHTCPYVGPQIVSGFYLRHQILRLPLPTADYLLTMNWILEKKLTFSTNIYFKFVEDL